MLPQNDGVYILDNEDYIHFINKYEIMGWGFFFNNLRLAGFLHKS